MRSTVLVLCAGVWLASFEPAFGRQTRGVPPPPQFRTSIDIVHMDVSVLDSRRRPVRGLTPADFTILENGKPQPVAVFGAIDIPDPAPPSAPWMRDVAPDVGRNDDINERRLFLIVIDDATVQLDLRAMTNVRAISRTFIERLGPSDLAAVVFTRDSRNAQDFTADRARLLAAVDKLPTSFRGIPEMPDDLWLQYSVGVLERAVETLSTLPDRRKAIIYVGQGVPISLASVVAGAAVSGVSLVDPKAQTRLQDQMSALFRQAARANVTIYPIDACGLRAPPPPPPYPPNCAPGIEVDYLRTLAANTGGRAGVDTNDFAPVVEAIFEENASYYLIGFRPADPRADGKFRRVEVRVNRFGVEVRTRNGYEAARPDAAKRQAQLAAAPLGAALAGILPKSDLSMQMSAVPMAVPGRREAAVAIVIGVRQPIREMATRNVERVDLLVRAFNSDGRPFGATRLRADVAVRAGSSGLGEYEIVLRLDLRPGRYQLRAAVNVGSLSTSGSLYHDVDVPDFSAAPVSLSPLMLSATPGPTVASQKELKAILPIVPTAQREFAATQRVAALARIYQGGKSSLATIALHMTIRNEKDEIVMDRRDDLAPERFAAGSRSTDYQLQLRVDHLAAGAYLLIVEAISGSITARRTSRFLIR